MFPELKKKASQIGFAELVGASKQAINQRVKEGKLPAGGTYAEWLQIYIDGLRDEAAGRADTSAQDVRKRKELAQAMREELELSKEYKLIVPTQDIAPDLVAVIKEVHTQVMEAGNVAIQSIESEHSIQVNDDLLFEPLRAALGNIAGRASQLVSRITGRPDATLSAAAITDGKVDRRKSKAAGRK